MSQGPHEISRLNYRQSRPEHSDGGQRGQVAHETYETYGTHMLPPLNPLTCLLPQPRYPLCEYVR